MRDRQRACESGGWPAARATHRGRARRRVALLALALAALAAAPAAAAAPKTDPRFKVPREELRATIRTIGLMPVTVPAGVPDAAAVAGRIDAEVAGRLSAAGIAYVPTQAMRDIRLRASEALGGVWDPLTGAAIPDKLGALDEYAAAEYRAAHPVDALLSVSVTARRASSGGGNVAWDGVRDSCDGRATLTNALVPNASGNVSVLSLEVRLTGVDGRLLYASTAGLQSLDFLGLSHSGRAYEQHRIDRKYIMSDPARDERALRIALDPLVGGARAPPGAARGAVPAAIPEPAVVTNGSRARLLPRFRRVALASTELPELGDVDAVRARYRGLLAKELARAGFDVVPVDDYAARMAQENVRAGGYYDPLTGALDEAKAGASRARVLESMRAEYQVAALVLPAIEVRVAPFEYLVAGWDGATEQVGPGRAGLDMVIGYDRFYRGEIRALSLAVRIVDLNGELLFEGTGGIQLAEHFSHGQHVGRLRQELLADPARDAAAVAIALRELAPPPPEQR